MGSGLFGAINYRSRKYAGGLYLVGQLRDIGRDRRALLGDKHDLDQRRGGPS